ncbi:hypothetical protein CC_2714 [Caulobacter vibrioides CB15]|uniref:Uncharacterized protein n=1 Tax=Caulobacter vibrioides (strain ATCC 19089 / CIP 103742 / CB 15) TaxID=190650 RepID=Q9A4W1_CAUVC|nr:hypothetical protein CC_2714 [Caulobacter vibrioides CB15]
MRRFRKAVPVSCTVRAGWRFGGRCAACRTLKIRPKRPALPRKPLTSARPQRRSLDPTPPGLKLSSRQCGPRPCPHRVTPSAWRWAPCGVVFVSASMRPAPHCPSTGSQQSYACRRRRCARRCHGWPAKTSSRNAARPTQGRNWMARPWLSSITCACCIWWRPWRRTPSGAPDIATGLRVRRSVSPPIWPSRAAIRPPHSQRCFWRSCSARMI